MKLWKILEDVEILSLNLVDVECNIVGLALKSSEVKKGFMFFAIKGETHDGNDYINEAIRNGASCVISETKHTNISSVEVRDVRIAMATISSNYYDSRHKQHKIIVATGTNGKTTTTYMLYEILKCSGQKATLIGTRGAYINEKNVYNGLTTPDPIILHKIIKQSYEMGVRIIIVELSAHAIYYKKLYGICAEIGLFTNFSQDHLDFFESMEFYGSVKKYAFLNPDIRYAIINVDDDLGEEIYRERIEKGLLATTCGIKKPADVFAIDIDMEEGIKCTINAYDEILELDTNFHGEFNLYNILLAVAAARALSVSSDTIINGYYTMEATPGRFNIINGKTIDAIVDFAHTPDGLRNLLITSRKLCKGTIILVFGCGGNRDKSKRKAMGLIAYELADYVIITEDNSRYEDANDITSEIAKGFNDNYFKYQIILDRKDAIKKACELAKPGDIIVIAGKGDEEYLDCNGIKKAYSDKNTIEEMIRSYSL
ncbi:MAG: UDP-N-acetylmuramoyl-L-alanyl-D-glutamate--2,6-diaminopimelate ligase [Christensenellaceae bacterium]|jgi:UDP-N-acetylmuramoyl-L-alanyl-D-glutamate--2,6-diaminopimelate ligase|nr:UDP-N-acetylmuramoyl-L-alanyl-D-glutamate--2,6-diaminopimelate ligase [Christensenellaceae bacterium]